MIWSISFFSLFSLSTSILSFATSPVFFPHFTVSFTKTVFTIFLALSAYLRVLKVSSNDSIDGFTQASMTVTELPPRDSLSKYVKTLFRYGTNEDKAVGLLVCNKQSEEHEEISDD